MNLKKTRRVAARIGHYARLPMALATMGLIGLAGCSGMPPSPSQTLYERLGGKEAIQAVVDNFIGNVAADARINGFFAQTDVPRLNRLLVEQICAATGGPCQYTGRDMRSAHAAMGITEAHFNALVEDLVASLDKFNVPQREKSELLSTLAAMKSDIVGDPGSGVKNDGELALPSDYRSWPVFLKDVQRPDLKQVRDIYINVRGLKSSRPFPYGTVMVMELYSVKTDAAGNPLTDTSGRLQKAALSKIFVMAKGPGWGQAVTPQLRTGEWAYSAFDATGKSLGGDASACRSCHVPMKDTDFVARVAEFEGARAKR